MPESGVRMTLRMMFRLGTPAEYGARRIRRLEYALDQERALVAVGEIKCAELMERLEQRDEIIANLKAQAEAARQTITELEIEVADLQYSLDTAVTAAWQNENAISFMFDDRPVDGPEDYATAPIDLTELRADLAAQEPLEGKITQYNEATGRHDTVEIKRPVFVGASRHEESEYTTPTYVPGMAKAS